MANLVAMSPEGRLDDRGRVTISPAFRKRLGKKFAQILMPDGVHLVAIPEKLEWFGKPIHADQARRLARQEIKREIDEELRTIHGVKRGRKR